MAMPRFDVATNTDSCPECGAPFIVAPCRSCKGKGQTLWFLKCKDCDGIGKKRCARISFLSYVPNLDRRLLSPKRHPINDGDTGPASSSVPLRRVRWDCSL